MVIYLNLMYLVDAYGPVVIDLPQAVDASANNNAKSMLLRDVNNITTYYAQFVPNLALTNLVKRCGHYMKQVN